MMDRTETARKLFQQAQRMTLGMAAAVVAYGGIAYYLIHIGKAGPAVFDAGTYPLIKYGALILSIMAVFVTQRAGVRIVGGSGTSLAASPPERHPQKLWVGTIVMCAGAEFPVIAGLVLVFLGRQVFDYIPFAAISIVGFVMAFPKKQQWSSWLGVEL